MKMRKGLAAVCIAAMLLAGCGQQEQQLFSPENPVEITVWNYYNGAQLEAFNSLVDTFNQTRGKELGITVQPSSEGSVNDLERNVIAAAEKEVGAKEVPNIFAAYADTAYKVDQMGLVADISPYFSKAEKAEYIENYLTEGDLSGNGSLKIFPIAKSTEIFLLNETDWNKFASATGAALDDLQTLEGVTQVAEAYYNWTDGQTAAPNDGKAFFGRDAVANYILVGAMQLGTEIISVDNEGNAVLNYQEETMRKLWDHYYVPYINGYFDANGRFRSDDVKTGNIISFVGSSTSVSFFPKEVILSDEEHYPITCIALKAPQFADAKSYAAQQGAGMVVTNGDEAEVAASVEFLKWFTEPEQNIQFSVASGYMPVKQAANDMAVIEEYVGDTAATSDSLRISIDTVNSNEMYTTVAIENGVDVRNVLEYSMADKAVADRAEILAKMEAGMSREEAVALYDTADNFQQWYQDTKAQLEASIYSN